MRECRAIIQKKFTYVYAHGQYDVNNLRHTVLISYYEYWRYSFDTYCRNTLLMQFSSKFTWDNNSTRRHWFSITINPRFLVAAFWLFLASTYRQTHVQNRWMAFWRTLINSYRNPSPVLCLIAFRDYPHTYKATVHGSRRNPSTASKVLYRN